MNVEIIEVSYRKKKPRQWPSKASKRPAKARKTPKPRKRAWKFKKTELAECDSAFSKEIIERDGRCLFPGCGTTNNLTNSHYFKRANWNTRFDPENCITLCIRHHFMDRDTAYEFQKARKPKHEWDGQYTIFQRNLLGEARWNALLERAEGGKTRKEAILETQKKYDLRQPLQQLNG